MFELYARDDKILKLMIYDLYSTDGLCAVDFAKRYRVSDSLYDKNIMRLRFCLDGDIQAEWVGKIKVLRRSGDMEIDLKNASEMKACTERYIEVSIFIQQVLGTRELSLSEITNEISYWNKSGKCYGKKEILLEYERNIGSGAAASVLEAYRKKVENVVGRIFYYDEKKMCYKPEIDMRIGTID